MARKTEAADRIDRDIRRQTRKRYSSEAKIRIVLAGLRGEYSTAMARRLLTHLRSVFNYATQRSPGMRHRYGLTHNPVALVGRGPGRDQPGKYGQDRARDRALSDTEIRALWQALDAYPAQPSTKAILRVLALTGQRASEVRKMNINELRLHGSEPEWEIPAQRTKNGLTHIVPLASPVVCILAERIGSRRLGAVFLAESGAPVGEYTPRQDVQRLLATDLIDIPLFTPHDLRRTVETGLAAMEIPKEIHDRVLIHKDTSVGGQHYNKFDYRRQKHEALERWATHVMSLNS